MKAWISTTQFDVISEIKPITRIRTDSDKTLVSNGEGSYKKSSLNLIAVKRKVLELF